MAFVPAIVLQLLRTSNIFKPAGAPRRTIWYRMPITKLKKSCAALFRSLLDGAFSRQDLKYRPISVPQRVYWLEPRRIETAKATTDTVYALYKRIAEAGCRFLSGLIMKSVAITPARSSTRRFRLLCSAEGSISELGETVDPRRHKSSYKPLDDYRTEFSTSIILFIIFYFHIIIYRVYRVGLSLALYLVIKIVTCPIIVKDLIQYHIIRGTGAAVIFHYRRH